MSQTPMSHDSTARNHERAGDSDERRTVQFMRFRWLQWPSWQGPVSQGALVPTAKRCSLMLCGMLLTLSAVAAPTPEVSAANVGVERAWIDGRRAALQSQWADHEAACHLKFAVNDCLKQVMREYRQELEPLRQQELALNERERRRRQQEQQARVQGKTTPQPSAGTASTPRMPSSSTSTGHHAVPEGHDAGSLAHSPMAAARPASQVPARRSSAVQGAGDSAEAQRQYREKLERARQKRLAREQRLNNPSSGSAQPLPLPP